MGVSDSQRGRIMKALLEGRNPPDPGTTARIFLDAYIEGVAEVLQPERAADLGRKTGQRDARKALRDCAVSDIGMLASDMMQKAIDAYIAGYRKALQEYDAEFLGKIDARKVVRNRKTPE